MLPTNQMLKKFPNLSIEESQVAGNIRVVHVGNPSIRRGQRINSSSHQNQLQQLTAEQSGKIWRLGDQTYQCPGPVGQQLENLFKSCGLSLLPRPIVTKMQSLPAEMKWMTLHTLITYAALVAVNSMSENSADCSTEDYKKIVILSKLLTKEMKLNKEVVETLKLILNKVCKVDLTLFSILFCIYKELKDYKNENFEEINKSHLRHLPSTYYNLEKLLLFKVNETKEDMTKQIKFQANTLPLSMANFNQKFDQFINDSTNQFEENNGLSLKLCKELIKETSVRDLLSSEFNSLSANSRFFKKGVHFKRVARGKYQISMRCPEVIGELATELKCRPLFINPDLYKMITLITNNEEDIERLEKGEEIVKILQDKEEFALTHSIISKVPFMNIEFSNKLMEMEGLQELLQSSFATQYASKSEHNITQNIYDKLNAISSFKQLKEILSLETFALQNFSILRTSRLLEKQDLEKTDETLLILREEILSLADGIKNLQEEFKLWRKKTFSSVILKTKWIMWFFIISESTTPEDIDINNFENFIQFHNKNPNLFLDLNPAFFEVARQGLEMDYSPAIIKLWDELIESNFKIVQSIEELSYHLNLIISFNSELKNNLEKYFDEIDAIKLKRSIAEAESLAYGNELCVDSKKVSKKKSTRKSVNHKCSIKPKKLRPTPGNLDSIVVKETLQPISHLNTTEIVLRPEEKIFVAFSTAMKLYKFKNEFAQSAWNSARKILNDLQAEVCDPQLSPEKAQHIVVLGSLLIEQLLTADMLEKINPSNKYECWSLLKHDSLFLFQNGSLNTSPKCSFFEAKIKEMGNLEIFARQLYTDPKNNRGAKLLQHIEKWRCHPSDVSDAAIMKRLSLFMYESLSFLNQFLASECIPSKELKNLKKIEYITQNTSTDHSDLEKKILNSLDSIIHTMNQFEQLPSVGQIDKYSAWSYVSDSLRHISMLRMRIASGENNGNIKNYYSVVASSLPLALEKISIALAHIKGAINLRGVLPQELNKNLVDWCEILDINDISSERLNYLYRANTLRHLSRYNEFFKHHSKLQVRKMSQQVDLVNNSLQNLRLLPKADDWRVSAPQMNQLKRQIENLQQKTLLGLEHFRVLLEMLKEEVNS